MTTSSSPEWRSTTRYMVAIGLTVFGLYLLYLSWPVLPALIIAILVAFLLTPIVNFLRKRLHFPKGLAILCAYLIAITVILLSPLVLLPPIIEAANYVMVLDYQALVTGGISALEQYLINLQQTGLQILGFQLDVSALVTPALESLREGGAAVKPQLPPVSTILQSVQSLFTVSFGVVGSVSSGVLAGVYVILASIYLTVAADSSHNQILEIIPVTYRPEIDLLLKRLYHTWSSFFRGQITLMVLIGIIVWIGGLILGIPGAGALALIAGMLEVLPSLGPFLATVPAVLVALLQGSTVLPISNLTFAIIVVIFYLLVQMFENNVIVPKVLGDAVDLHPLLVMTGVLVGASTAGILGALLAAPILASIKEIVSYSYRKIMAQDPFPESKRLPPPRPPSLADMLAALKGFYERVRERLANMRRR